MTKFATRQEYHDWVEAQEWYQTIRLGNGLVTPGSVRTDLRESFLDRLDVTGKQVLDVGCNSGQYCLWAKRHGAARVVGIDLADNRLEQARVLATNEGLEVEFLNLGLLDAARLGSFDIVFCFAVLTEIADFSGAVRALQQLIGSQGIIELDLASPFGLGGLHPIRKGRGRAELRRNKRGDWIVSPSFRTLVRVFGSDFDLKRGGKGIRYQVVHVYRSGNNNRTRGQYA